MRIVIGFDGSLEAAIACDLVAGLSWPAGTSVRLVAVIEPHTRDEQRVVLTLAMDARAEALRRHGIPCEIVVEAGRPAETLIAHAAGWWADLVVVGNRGRGGAASAILGSVSAHLVDHAPCPVLVARSRRVSRMVLATDGSRSCLGVPRILAHWRPALHGVDVEVVSIAPGSRRGDVAPEAELPDPDLADHRRIAEEVADEMNELGWRAAAVTRAGDPSSEIVQAAAGYGADLVVTGSRGLGTVARLLQGSVAHDVMLGTRASVLVVRGGVPARTTQPSAALAPA